MLKAAWMMALSVLVFSGLGVACGSDLGQGNPAGLDAASGLPLDGSTAGLDGSTSVPTDASTLAKADAAATTGLDASTASGLDASATAGLDASTTAGLDAAGSAPADHTLILGGVSHKPGNTDPLKNCVACHGAGLTGGVGPSCYGCHNSNDHTLPRGPSGVKHKSGTTSSCNPCHGPGNAGGLGPACSNCH